MSKNEHNARAIILKIVKLIYVLANVPPTQIYFKHDFSESFVKNRLMGPFRLGIQPITHFICFLCVLHVSFLLVIVLKSPKTVH